MLSRLTYLIIAVLIGIFLALLSARVIVPVHLLFLSLALLFLSSPGCLISLIALIPLLRRSAQQNPAIHGKVQMGLAFVAFATAFALAMFLMVTILVGTDELASEYSGTKFELELYSNNAIVDILRREFIPPPLRLTQPYLLYKR
jgi:hypothetical protein